MIKKVKNVLLKIELEGKGIVNYDSSDQKYVMSKINKRKYNDNTSFAKKDFFLTEDESLDYKIKISSNCMLKSVLKNEMVAQIPSVVHHDYLLYSYIASPQALINGYMFPDKGIKRSSPFSLTDATQISKTKSNIELFSRSGEKKSQDGSSDEKDTTLYFKETIGDIEYEAIGQIDLMGLEFIPCDQVFDRFQFEPDKFNVYKEFLEKKMPDSNLELNYFQFKNSSIEIPEYGVKLSEKNVKFLIKLILENVLQINVVRKNSYAKIKSLQLKFVVDPIKDTFKSDNGWIKITKMSDIENLDYSTHEFYDLVNLEDAKKFRADFDDKIEIAKKLKKANKDAKKANKTVNKKSDGE